MRKLASIQVIRDLQPIVNADKIEVASINSWKVVVQKGLYKVGDKVTYFEIDSFIPLNDNLKWLESSSRLAPNGKVGYKIKSIKLKNQLSQGLIIPISVAETMFIDKSLQTYWLKDKEDGFDLTSLLGITKYEDNIIEISNDGTRKSWPEFISKTDEERIQNLTDEYEELKKLTWLVTEKLEGTSFTAFLKDGEFGVCSRNNHLVTEQGVYWVVAKQYDIENRMKQLGINIAVQGEVIGIKVNGNIYKMNTLDLQIFRIWDIDNQKLLPQHSVREICRNLGLTQVPLLLNESETLPDTIDELIIRADGQSVLNKDSLREGLVFRSLDGQKSFKVISNKYLLNSNERNAFKIERESKVEK